MNFARINSMILRSVRVLVVAFACAMLFFTNALPAAAISSTPSNYSKGEEPLDKIFEDSQDVTDSPPMSMEETQQRANEGINEIQGASDRERMYTPENSEGTTAKDQAQNVLERITGKK
ncbi:MAG: hypothetical protein Kow00121_44400 [Elainellaceae cyanobacterium]